MFAARFLVGVIALGAAASGCKDATDDRPRVATDRPNAGPEQPAVAAEQPPARSDKPLSRAERAAIGGHIAFVSERSSENAGDSTGKDIWLITPSGDSRALSAEPGDEFPASVAPGGAQLAVIASREEGGVHREQLRVVDLASGQTRALNEPRGRARNPSFGPDGSWLIAESDAQGFSDLVRISLATSGDEAGDVKGGGDGGDDAYPTAVPVATAPEGNFEPSVSPDGRRIAFVSSRTGDPEIYVMDADGANLTRITAFHREDWAPEWSPDGQWLAFLSSREGRDRVFIVRPDGSDVRAISGDAPTGQERDLAWSPSSDRLAFSGRQPDGTRRIWLAATAGGPATALTDARGHSDQPTWSPDGDYLVFVSEVAGDPELFLMRADGSGQTRLTHAPGADWLPRWIPTAMAPANRAARP